MSIRSLVLFLAAAFTAAPQMFAQALGNVVGTVTDQVGATVPGAAVTILNEGTKFVRSTITNESGQFAANSFPTGRITVTAEREGFQKLVRSGLELTAADTITVNLQLSLGSVQQSVEVQAEASLVQSQTATVSTLINSTQTLEMPLNERSFTNLLQLTPGASPSSVPSADLDHRATELRDGSPGGRVALQADSRYESKARENRTRAHSEAAALDCCGSLLALNFAQNTFV